MSQIVVLNAYYSPEVLWHVYEKAHEKKPFLEGFKVVRELLPYIKEVLTPRLWGIGGALTGSTQLKAPLHVYSGQLCQNYGASPMSVPTVC